MLAEHGAVSEPVARAMAEGARSRYASDFACSTTGIAGPGGGSETKPVGTVHIAVATPNETHHRLLRVPGDREKVRQLTSQHLLEMMRRVLIDL
jgi:nicotinamide-nucleotide amidase